MRIPNNVRPLGQNGISSSSKLSVGIAAGALRLGVVDLGATVHRAVRTQLPAAAAEPIGLDNMCTAGHSIRVIELIKSRTFDAWLSGLRDLRAAARIQVRLDRLAQGNPGDVRTVGGGISEMRIDYGPGYRVYYLQRGPVLIVLLCGGDKRTQDADIAAAKSIANQWR